jgi:hypothetical protein
VTPESAVTWTGVDRVVSVLSPICPWLLRPKVHTVPSLFSTTLCAAPPASVWAATGTAATRMMSAKRKRRRIVGIRVPAPPGTVGTRRD